MSENSWGEGEGGAPGREDTPIHAIEPPPGWRRPSPSGSAVAPHARSDASPTTHHAAHLSETSGSAYLYCSMAGVFREVGPDAYKAYLTKVLADAGNPSDPIERMLIEQITLAHHNVGRLHVKAASAESLEEARVYIGSAALLTGEFRRTVSTLKNYREPSGAIASRPETGLAARSGTGVGPPPRDGVEAPLSELGSNISPGATDHAATIVPFAAQPEAGGGRPDEPPEAAGADRRRGRKAPRRGLG